MEIMMQPGPFYSMVGASGFFALVGVGSYLAYEAMKTNQPEFPHEELPRSSDAHLNKDIEIASPPQRSLEDEKSFSDDGPESARPLTEADRIET